MPTQKLTLGNDGIVVPNRIRPYVSSEARNRPAIRLSRLQKLLQTHAPSIAIIRGEGIGDVIMTLPTVHALKRMFKECRITYATNTRYLDGALAKVLKYNPDIDEIIERELLQDSDYDLVLNLHCPASTYEKPGVPPINRIDIFAQHAGVTLLDPVPHYYIQKEEVARASRLTERIMGKKIIVQPCASTSRRSLDHQKLKKSLVDLSQRYNISSLIITHTSDFSKETLWDNVPGSVILNNLDSREIAAVAVHCDLVLCPDSSILHLAGCLGIPTVSYFGPTDPRARVNHFPNAVALWEGDQLNCSPCWYNACNFKHVCWDMISSEMVTQACVQHIKKTSKVDIDALLAMNKGIKIETEIV